MQRKDFAYESTEILAGDTKIVFITDENTSLSGETGVHMHAFWELLYLTQGSLIVTGETERFDLQEKEGLIIPPGAYHSSRSRADDEKKSVFFTFEKVKNTGEEPLFDKILTAFGGTFRKIADKDRVADRLLTDVLEGYPPGTLGGSVRQKAAIVQLIFHLYDTVKDDAETAGVSTGFEGSSWIYKYTVDRLMDLYYPTDISLSELSAKLFLSPQSVARILSSVYGKSFNELKLELKMRNAKKLLRETDLPVSKIGRQIGYTTARGFQAAFSRYEGCTPGTWRKQHRTWKTTGGNPEKM